MKYQSISVVGPTASGKTHRAVSIAKAFDGEIISADSRQIYRGMDLGTGKDLDEYGDIPYHLIDVADAGDKFNLHRYLADFKTVYDDILDRGVLPVICGGSGMYVENALSGVSLPEVSENKELRAELSGKSIEQLTRILQGMKKLHNITDVDTAQRAIRAIEIATYYGEHPEEAAKADAAKAEPLDSLIIGIDIPREARRRRISERLEARLKSGMIDEVRRLLESGISAEDLIYYGLEYKFVTLHVLGKLTYEEMYRQLEIAIHQFAKRQMTWFRGMERRGYEIHWLPYDMPESDFLSEVTLLLEK